MDNEDPITKFNHLVKLFNSIQPKAPQSNRDKQIKLATKIRAIYDINKMIDDIAIPPPWRAPL